MNKTIGSLPVWQFVLLLGIVLTLFTALASAFRKRQNPSA